MDLEPVNARWQSQMRDFFIDPGARDPDKQMFSIEEVFHLD
jgi:L-rhamnose mutarotase